MDEDKGSIFIGIILLINISGIIAIFILELANSLSVGFTFILNLSSILFCIIILISFFVEEEDDKSEICPENAPEQTGNQIVDGIIGILYLILFIFLIIKLFFLIPKKCGKNASRECSCFFITVISLILLLIYHSDLNKNDYIPYLFCISFSLCIINFLGTFVPCTVYGLSLLFKKINCKRCCKFSNCDCCKKCFCCLNLCKKSQINILIGNKTSNTNIDLKEKEYPKKENLEVTPENFFSDLEKNNDGIESNDNYTRPINNNTPN